MVDQGPSKKRFSEISNWPNTWLFLIRGKGRSKFLSLMSSFPEVKSLIEEKSALHKTEEEDLDLEEQQQQTAFDIFELKQVVEIASEGALTTKTVATYRR